MIIGLLTLDLCIPMCSSLKEKRRHLNALKANLSRDFNVSVAEIGEHDKWQAAVLAVAHVGLTRPVVDSVLSHIVAYVERFKSVEITNHQTELIT